MIRWHDEGIVVHVSPIAEVSAKVSIFTRDHGLHHGAIKGRTSKRWVQVGSRGCVQWQAKMDDQMGYWGMDTLRQPLIAHYHDPLKLDVFTSAAALSYRLLAERHPYEVLFHALTNLIDAMTTQTWMHSYLVFESTLLAQLGYALSLDHCAVTGSVDDLSHISPKTGRAVHKDIAQPYKDRLLTLPKVLLQLHQPTALSARELWDGLHVTGFFIEKFLLQPHHLGAPPTRQRLMERLRHKGRQDS